MKISKCKGCGVDILWGKTEKGKMMPLDKKEITTWVKTPQGHFPDIVPFKSHMPHWATCPKSKDFKK